MSEENKADKPDLKPMYKDGVEMMVSQNPDGRKILAASGWKEDKK